MKSLTLTILCLSVASPAAAEVADSSANGFAVRNVAVIAAHPSRVYNAGVESVARWWNPAHSYSKNSANLSNDSSRSGGPNSRANNKE